MDAKQAMSNEIWLNYFNRHLYEKGIISELERNKMKIMIESKCRANGKDISSQIYNAAFHALPGEEFLCLVCGVTFGYPSQVKGHAGAA